MQAVSSQTNRRFAAARVEMLIRRKKNTEVPNTGATQFDPEKAGGA